MKDYRILFKEENEAVKERFDLSMERIRLIRTEDTVMEPFREYFKKMASFIEMVEAWGHFLEEKGEGASLEEFKDWNERLYGDILPENYESSYGNPAYAVAKLGDGYGQLLSYFYKELRGDIVFIRESRLTDFTILNETLIEIYNRFEEEIPEVSVLKEVLYWFVSDYTDYTVSYRVREGLDPDLSFGTDIIRESDLTDLRYLYRFGEYISDTELKVAAFLNSLPEERVRLMADTCTEGYKKSFSVMGRDLSKKNTVMLRFQSGFERMVKYAIENFEKMGLRVILCRRPVWSVNENPGRRTGYQSTSPNRQFDYDHRYDAAIYMNKAFKERKAAVTKAAYETYKKEAGKYAGPAVIETFGKEGFLPVNKPQALKFETRQEKLFHELSNEIAGITNQYIPGDETSFTIIAFPVPEIGPYFQRIFEETIEINTLDYEKYKGFQQIIIDALDEAEYVEITGKDNNHTSLKITLRQLTDPIRETKFENCVADVNIPLGEVFTSPVLAGTEGTLEVGTVYIGEFQFKDLKITFENGMIKDYSCSNFENLQEGRALVKQVILKNHTTLPMGEFAIGTNTTAYAMARKYDILDKLPILIVEKMGPHFAVGDTCYSWSEDSPMYNPDGKEVIARDNEVSALRKEDLSRAYFNCHTDITIPYNELGKIEAVTREGRRISIIEEGRFTLKGTEELNGPLLGL